MTASNDSKQKITAIGAVVSVLLLSVIAFLLYNKTSQDQTIEKQALELVEADKLKAELNEQYYEALSNLEEMKGDNKELNALIETQKEELKTQKNRISGLIKSGKSSKAELDLVRSEIGKLIAQRDGYMQDLNRQKEENQRLAQTNTDLQVQRQTLQEEVIVERTNVENLVTEKAVLLVQKEKLEEVQEVLTKKVNYGSVIRVADVSATGWKIKKSGKPVKKTYAKNVDQLKVCFNTTVNELASGNETFHIRVINPIGETMAVEEMGSGVFTNTDTKEQIRYTQSKDVDYNKGEELYCFNWSANTPFQKGTYEIEVYNKGYISGKGSCFLK